MDRILKKDAVRFRETNGISATEPIRLSSLLLKLNVLTVFKPLSDNFSGMALKINDQRFMMVNSSQSLGKQHFTICHELYHLFVQPDFRSMTCITGKFSKADNKIEYYADLFAAYLLLPEDGILEMVPNHEIPKDKISIETVLKIEQYYSSSRSALLYRLKELGYITSIKYDQFCKNVKRSASEHGYMDTLYKPGNNNVVIGNYGNIARKLYDNEQISESHYLSLMHDIGIDINQEEDNG